MKILMILSNPFMVDPRVNREAKALVSAGHEVTVITWDRKHDYESESIVDGVKIIRIHNKGLMKFLPNDLMRNPFWWRMAYKKGLELFKNDFRFDIIHCHDLDTLQSGVWLKKKLNVKLIYDSHEIFGYMIARSVPKFVVNTAFCIERRLIRYVDSIITVNEPLKKYFKSMTSKLITIIMNSKDLLTDEYVPPKNDLFTVFYSGALNKSRMFPEIVDIIGNIDSVKFVIAGRKESLYNEVKEKCMKYKNVEFLGTISIEAVINQTVESDAILCLFDPTDQNNKVGLPNKIFESMVAGRPIIVTKGLYCSEIIEEEKCGMVINYEKDSVKNAINQLRKKPELCEELGRNALQAAIKKYNWKKQEEKLIKTYEDLIK